MKRLLIAVIPFFLSGCADPFRETISTFKKSDHMEKLTKCAGLTGKFEFKPFGQGDKSRYPALAKEDAPMLKISLEKEINGKIEVIHFFFAYNKQTFLFADKGYSSDNEKLKYEDFCSNSRNEIPGKASSSKISPDSESKYEESSKKIDEYALALGAIKKAGIQITSKNGDNFTPYSLVLLNVADYTATFKVQDGFQLSGHDLVFLEHDRVIQWVGCCPRKGLTLTVRLDGDRTSLINFANRNNCRTEKPNMNHLAALAEEKKISAPAPGSYISIDCTEDN